MEDLIASINEANNYKERDNKKFVSIADHIRSVVSPKTSYPGILSELNLKIIDQIINILSFFRSLVLNNISVFQKNHIIRAIDSMNLISLALTIKYQQTGDESNLYNAKREFNEAINSCKQNGLESDIQISVSAIYNVASFLMKLKAYSHSIDLFKMVSNLTNKNELVAKANKSTCQCLIALGDYKNSNFLNLLCKSSDQINTIAMLAQINPPTNPNVVSEMISVVSKSCQIQNFQNELRRILPFYALHGDFNKLKDYPEYKNFFPELQPPNIPLFNNQELDNWFIRCHQLFSNSMFYDCVVQSVELLKHFPQSRITLHMNIALFFIHYWIIYSYDATGKPDAGRFYANKMYKLFLKYPFACGFSVFLELKCKIHYQRLNKIREIPKMQFDAQYNWDSVYVLYKAVCEFFCTYDYNCIDTFDEIFNEHNNLIVQREAFNYFVNALKYYQYEFSLKDFPKFQEVCSTSNETKALFLYHKVIENVKNFDFKELWKYCENKNVNLEAVNMNISMLDEAERHAKGYLSITRKIKQLKALLIGTSDMEKAAILIQSSLSLFLDKQLQSCPKAFQYKFPILASIYITIPDIEPCLLFAYFCPHAKPFVVRIETGDAVENFFDKLNQIHEENNLISPDLTPREWWTKKLVLDKKLATLINDFETHVLKFWKCLFSPISATPQQQPIISCLLSYLRTIPQKNLEQVKTQIERITGLTFPKRVYQSKSQPMTIQLLLGKFIHQIPWESMPFVIENKVSITRIPSMKVAAIQTMKQLPVFIDPHSAFYVLNPKNDLTTTEANIGPLFNKLDWKGFVKKFPNRDEMVRNLQDNDLFVYCGHGSGREFFDYDALINEKKSCKSTMLLMGCCSGKLMDEGDTDPAGVPYSCIAAGSGTVVANLWDVTDGEINRFLTSLLEKMKRNEKSDDQFILESAVLQCRNACKLKYLTGAAPVVYGFPTLVHKLI